MVFTGHGPYTHSIRQALFTAHCAVYYRLKGDIHTGIPTQITANTITKGLKGYNCFTFELWFTGIMRLHGPRYRRSRT